MSSENMRTCANCGNEVREGARFCASCGAPVAPADEQLAPDEPQPIVSPSRKRGLRLVAVGAAAALLVAGGAAAALWITGKDDPTPVVLDTTDPYGDTTDIYGDTTTTTDPYSDTTDIYGDTTTTTQGSIGQGVDQTCEDIVAFLALTIETDIARGGNSVDDVERVAAAASDLASKAPQDSIGEPRESFLAIAGAYAIYLSVLSAQGLEPGPDALLEPTISAAFEDVGTQILLGVAPWTEEHCSPEVLDQIAQLGSPG